MERINLQNKQILIKKNAVICVHKALKLYTTLILLQNIDLKVIGAGPILLWSCLGTYVFVFFRIYPAMLWLQPP